MALDENDKLNIFLRNKNNDDVVLLLKEIEDQDLEIQQLEAALEEKE